MQIETKTDFNSSNTVKTSVRKDIRIWSVGVKKGFTRGSPEVHQGVNGILSFDQI